MTTPAASALQRHWGRRAWGGRNWGPLLELVHGGVAVLGALLVGAQPATHGAAVERHHTHGHLQPVAAHVAQAHLAGVAKGDGVVQGPGVERLAECADVAFDLSFPPRHLEGAQLRGGHAAQVGVARVDERRGQVPSVGEGRGDLAGCHRAQQAERPVNNLLGADDGTAHGGVLGGGFHGTSCKNYRITQPNFWSSERLTPTAFYCILRTLYTFALMNVSELARQLRIHPAKLLQILPEFGFDIGAKAVKVDDRVAQRIQREWKRIKFVVEQREKAEKEKEKLREKELRKESGATVAIPTRLTVRELADKLALPVNKLIVELMKNGILANQNQNIDRDTATIIAQDLGFNVIDQGQNTDNAAADEHVEKLEALLNETAHTKPRAPVIVVMGHVDHGKTKLLDAIRSANVVATESGGITQHIGAYQVIWKNPKTKHEDALTFIDTPGHEAFTVMRSRGAKVADIAILVVAADDSVKPQTVEAINIIKAAKLPVVVAINKMDKAGADANKVKSDLAQLSIQADDWGGDVPMVEISAKENKNIDKLLDTLLLVAEVQAETIKADPDRAAAGTVIEARVDKGQGPVATVLVQAGTLHVNDALVVNGQVYGKVRALKNYRGEDIKMAGPSTPARILGFKIAPQVGDVLDNTTASTAEKIDVRGKRTEQTGAEQHTKPASEESGEEEGKKSLSVIVKADTLGSLEAIIGSLERLKNEEVSVKVAGKGLGNITADDVARAEATGAILYGFHVTTTPIAFEMLQKSQARFRHHTIIYDLFDEVKEELRKLLNPELIVTELGNFKVMAIFRTDKKIMVVGGRVEMGKLLKGVPVRVKRDKEIIGLGKIAELQSGKQRVNEVPEGNECGLQFEGKLKLEEGDILEAYKEETKEKKLVLN